MRTCSHSPSPFDLSIGKVQLWGTPAVPNCFFQGTFASACLILRRDLNAVVGAEFALFPPCFLPLIWSLFTPLPAPNFPSMFCGDS